jgi:type III restriction enzyme
VRKLSVLGPATLEAIYDQEDLDEVFRINLKMAFATTETEVHQADLAAGTLPMAQALLGAITNKVIRQAGLTNAFADLFPIVRTYVATRCFGKTIDVDHDTIRSHLQRLEMQGGYRQVSGTKHYRTHRRKTRGRVRQG